ncbi:hypothetical protein QL285_025322 [Trifolium repens]|nr:hypothetical protein QL285_025322 [Trifolium repens]
MIQLSIITSNNPKVIIFPLIKIISPKREKSERSWGWRNRFSPFLLITLRMKQYSLTLRNSEFSSPSISSFPLVLSSSSKEGLFLSILFLPPFFKMKVSIFLILT